MAFLAREIAEQKRVDLAVASSLTAPLLYPSSGIGPGSAGAGHPSPYSENPPSSVVSSAAASGVVPVAPLLGVVGGGGAGLGSGTGVSGANIHVVLPGDRDAQRRKHRSKVTYYEKGAQC